MTIKVTNTLVLYIFLTASQTASVLAGANGASANHPSNIEAKLGSPLGAIVPPDLYLSIAQVNILLVQIAEFEAEAGKIPAELKRFKDRLLALKNSH